MEIYETDVGVTLDFETSIDLTGNTSVDVRVKKPDGTTAIWSAAVQGAATAGVIRHTIPTALAVGDYGMQPYVEFSASQKYRGRTAHLRVKASFE